MRRRKSVSVEKEPQHMNLFGKYGGYRTLDSFTLASVIPLGTWRFCTRFLDRRNDSDRAVHALLLLIGRTLNMLARQKEAQGEAFRHEGGFRERLTAARLETRDRQKAEAGAPVCPECGKPMRQRRARSGRNASRPFWGCPGYPDCKGTREVEEEASGERRPSTPSD